LELELLVVPSYVIPRKPIFLFKHGESMDLRKKLLEKREIGRKGRRRKRKGKITYVKA
jgi:hypothetical protein